MNCKSGPKAWAVEMNRNNFEWFAFDQEVKNV